MIIDTMTCTVRQWKRLGAMFGGAEYADAPVDIERLLLDTARQTPDNIRLLIMSMTWLAHYGHAVDDRRLGELIREELSLSDQPIMGLMLELARGHAVVPGDYFAAGIAACQPASAEGAGPLSIVDQTPFLSNYVRERASAESLRWGRWTEPVELTLRALRPAGWIFEHNPTLRRGAEDVE